MSRDHMVARLGGAYRCIARDKQSIGSTELFLTFSFLELFDLVPVRLIPKGMGLFLTHELPDLPPSPNWGPQSR